jgi:molecular chaperone HtpG
MLLHGVIDSPDIPLNVSRSFLQADSNVKKINSYITKKVADKLAELFKADRTSFEKKFEDIGLFVKYGMLSDDKFYEKAKDFCLLKSVDNKYYTLNEYTEYVQANQKDKDGNTIFLYTSDAEKQNSYIQSAQKRSYDVLQLDTMIDSHFINMLESKVEKTQLKRVDADSIEKLIDKGIAAESTLNEAENTKLKELFDGILNDKMKQVTVEPMPVDELPATITFNEFMRRMNDMSKTGGGGMNMFGNMPLGYNVTLNANSPAIAKLLKTKKVEDQTKLAKQILDLALISQNMLTGAQLTDFVKRTAESL